MQFSWRDPEAMLDHARRQAHARRSSRPCAALAFALRYAGRKRVHNADELMAEVVARRLVEHLERSGFVVMRRARDLFGGATLGRGFEG
jgi:hypothetical protein